MNTKFYFNTLLIFLFVTFINLDAQQLAFPGAEGFGRFATGGRTGTVYHVTNLSDAGTGSFRDAVSQPNRIVVFDVAGVIKITSRIVVSANIYIAGQTAPGEGITIYGNGFSFSGAENTICRYIRIRMGAGGDSGKDAIGIANGGSMIFDHVSVSWGRDETFSINWDSKGAEPNKITIQNCIISQGLQSHSAGGLIQTNQGVTLYRNMYIDNDTRNNKVKGVNQYVNNIVYNWQSGAYIMGGDSEGDSYVNVVGNYFVKGPAGGGAPIGGGNANFHLYADDNWHDADKNGILDGYKIPFSEYSGGPDFQATPYSYPTLPTLDATLLMQNVLPSVGASLPYRDYVDYYVLNEVKSLGKKGDFISNENELPFGIPSSWALWAGTKRTDTDNDGIPDDWETANGLNPALASDAMLIAPNGYTNIENYINDIGASYSQDYLRAPLCLSVLSSTQNSITFKWLDYTDKEDGYIIERKINGVFTEIGRNAANVDTFLLSGLAPEEADTFRVRAYNSTLSSGNSNEIIAKTKPVPVVVTDPATYVPDMTWSGLINSTWDKSTNNWDLTGTPGVFTDNSKILFGNVTAGNQSITLSEKVAPSVVFVTSNNDYTFQGDSITGTTSVNKTGTGKLALLNTNKYTGATVLWNGTMEINKLATGGLPSSIGASQNYNFNWVWKGGKTVYSGATVSTDRNIALDGTSEFSVSNSNAVVAFTGSISGSGGLIKSGPGKLFCTNANPYLGETVISEGILELNGLTAINGGLGTSPVLKLEGGTLKTSSGSAAEYETYAFDINVAAGKTSSLELDRTCYLKNKVSGSGTLNYNISYSRELIQGDWSQFSGTLVANGIGTLTGAERSMLQINNSSGFPNARIVAAGNTKIVSYKNAVTFYLGGLSGPTTTNLSCGDKSNANATVTWIVGGAGTDETFNGIINNECYSSNNGTTTIVKEGLGIWRLTGNNIYKGTTTVNGGTLIVNGAHTGTGKVSIEDGGTLAGKGSLAAAVEVKSGGTLQPGDSDISTFTMAGLTLNTGSFTKMDINKTVSTNDKVVVNGAAVFEGTLVLTITGTLARNDAFTLFTGTSTTGSFSQITPASPGNGLKWNFTNGVLKVDSLPVQASQPSPANNAIGIDSVSVNLGWTAASGANSYNIFFGTDQNNLIQKSTGQTDAVYTVSSLTGSTKYYWRVDGVNGTGITTGNVWAFTTKIPIPKLAFSPTPADASANIDTMSLNLGWTGGFGSDSYNVYFGADQNSLIQKSTNQAGNTFSVTGLKGNATYYWRIDATNAGGTNTGTLWSFTTKKGSSTGFSVLQSIQLSYFPNPFKDNITIRFNLPDKEDVSLEICDLSGKLIRKLTQHKLNAGFHEFTWNGTNANGNSMQNGLYLLMLKTSQGEEIKKIMYNKE